jgi:transportin-3
MGEQFIPIRDSIIIPRGASITRILVASLTGALPKSRVEVVISQVNVDCISFS